MENQKTNNSILSDVIRATCLLKDRLLFYNEYEKMVPENCKIADVTYCEIKNFTQDNNMTDTRVTVHIEFDLLIIYKIITPDGTEEYRFHTEKPKCRIDIEKRLYNFACDNIAMSTLKCRNLVRNVVYLKDVDLTCKKMIISITASIESMLVEENAINLNNTLVASKQEASNHTSVSMLPAASILTDTTGDISAHILHLDNLIKRASCINETNKNLQNDISSKDRRIYFLECRIKQLEEEAAKNDAGLKTKDNTIKDLWVRLEKSEKKNAILENSNTVMNQEILSHISQIENLKKYIQEQEDIKKKQLNYKIKSAISNIKLF